ncbi:transposase [Patulibacter sp. NPDC049589]|uniref:IS66 family transposase n=1 Tax=Patulibacter sp. NPDC049589 TaxID=3154731 RepID=UPI0034422CEF
MHADKRAGAVSTTTGRAGCGSLRPGRWSRFRRPRFVSTGRGPRRRPHGFWGELPGGIVVSDRYCGYNDLDPLQQACCWAHLKRDLVKLSERAGPPGRPAGSDDSCCTRPVWCLPRSTGTASSATSPRCSVRSRRFVTRSTRCCTKAPS